MTVHVVDKVVLSGGGNAAPQPQPRRELAGTLDGVPITYDPQIIEQAKLAAHMVQFVQQRGAQLIARSVRNHLVERHPHMVLEIARSRSIR